MRRELAGEFRREREAFVQPGGQCRRGLAVAGIDRHQEQAEQWPADRLQGLDHAGALFEEDAAHVAVALQELGRQRGVHLGGQMRLPVPPYGVRRDAESLGDGSFGEAGCDRQIDLGPRRVPANRAAQPYSPFWYFFRLTPVTARVRYRANKSTLGVALAIAPITCHARLRPLG